MAERWIRMSNFSTLMIVFVACHSAEDAEEDAKRKKRQAQQPNPIRADNTQTIRNYFLNCLRSGVSKAVV